MVTLDERWRVPESYEPDLDFGGRVLRQRSLPGVPALNMLSYLVLEEQLTATGPFSTLAWQLLADDDAAVVQTVHQMLADPSVDRLWCAAILQVATDPEMRGLAVAKQAWQATANSPGEQRVMAGLMLVNSAQPITAEKAGVFLDKIEAGLSHASPLQRAVYALTRAALDPKPALLDEAHKQFSALDDAFGLAQCAIIAYQQELASQKRPELLRGYLEHAIYRYDIGRRESWAARAITYALIPLLEVMRTPDEEIATWLQRAAGFALGAQSLPELRGVFRLARKLGFSGTVVTLEASDPPQFERTGLPMRASQPVIPVAMPAAAMPAEVPAAAATQAAAAPIPAPAAAADKPPEAPAADKPAEKKGGKKKGKGAKARA